MFSSRQCFVQRKRQTIPESHAVSVRSIQMGSQQVAPAGQHVISFQVAVFRQVETFKIPSTHCLSPSEHTRDLQEWSPSFQGQSILKCFSVVPVHTTQCACCRWPCHDRQTERRTVRADHPPRSPNMSTQQNPHRNTTTSHISQHSSAGRDSSKNYGADQQRLQISDLHFDKFPTPASFACWKVKFKTEVRICSQFLTEVVLWIKEVEMVDSVDDLKSSSSTREFPKPNFEVLDVRIASALNRIIHNSHFKRRISLEEQKAQKKRPFRSWKTDRLPDLRVLPGQWGQ